MWIDIFDQEVIWLDFLGHLCLPSDYDLGDSKLKKRPLPILFHFRRLSWMLYWPINQTLRMSEYKGPSLWPVFDSKGSEPEEDLVERQCRIWEGSVLSTEYQFCTSIAYPIFPCKYQIQIWILTSSKGMKISWFLHKGLSLPP